MGVFDFIKAAAKPPQKRAKFVLMYQPAPDDRVTVGHLTYENQVWTFRYDADYKRRTDLRPIEGLDNLDEEYRSTVLFPFFAVRIPDSARKDVRVRLREDRLKDPDLVDMLRLFGRRVVSSPAFELIPAA